jgi:hypothetical protein
VSELEDGVETEEGELVDLQLDAEQANLLTFLGRRGCGKSRAARYYFDSYPFDRIVIDPNGDMELEGALELVPPIPVIPILEGGRYPPPPAPWPYDELGRVTLHYVPNLSDPDHEADTDDVVRLAFARGRCLLLVDEILTVAKANQVLPAMDLTLQQFRHRDETMILCGPRPVGIDPMTITQADLVVLFRMRGIHDRRRIAELTGLSLEVVTSLLMTLPKFESVVVDDREGEGTVICCPPLPPP